MYLSEINEGTLFNLASDGYIYLKLMPPFYEDEPDEDAPNVARIGDGATFRFRDDTEVIPIKADVYQLEGLKWGME